MTLPLVKELDTALADLRLTVDERAELRMVAAGLSRQAKALIPVIARPTISDCTESVPS